MCTCLAMYTECVAEICSVNCCRASDTAQSSFSTAALSYSAPSAPPPYRLQPLALPSETQLAMIRLVGDARGNLAHRLCCHRLNFMKLMFVRFQATTTTSTTSSSTATSASDHTAFRWAPPLLQCIHAVPFPDTLVSDGIMYSSATKHSPTTTG